MVSVFFMMASNSRFGLDHRVSLFIQMNSDGFGQGVKTVTMIDGIVFPMSCHIPASL
jgi:hypothetical protein